MKLLLEIQRVVASEAGPQAWLHLLSIPGALAPWRDGERVIQGMLGAGETACTAPRGSSTCQRPLVNDRTALVAGAHEHRGCLGNQLDVVLGHRPAVRAL